MGKIVFGMCILGSQMGSVELRKPAVHQDHNYQKWSPTESTSSGGECSNHSSTVSRTTTSNSLVQKALLDLREF